MFCDLWRVRGIPGKAPVPHKYLAQKAYEAVKAQFELTDLLPKQQEAIKAFFKGKNVFVNLPTGFGKSLIFQSLPIVADIVSSKPRGSTVIVVISPLRSVMEDQV